ncbi:UbiA prenyltransferase family [Xylariaceae sp. FL0662B]|nr:UbiA prenyltransferase family [Xylariaceae sp. FL0662B]
MFPKNTTFTLNNMFHCLTYHAYSTWLFTFSDLKTIVIPETAFGILTALSQTDGRQESPRGGFATSHQVIRRLPLVMTWVWINLLPFAINNQRRPEAIAEDSLNKPWRAMPSGRLTTVQAQYAMYFFYVVAVAVSWKIGGLRSCVAIIALGHWYNGGGGSDVNALLRNLINAVGFMAFGTGALELALDGHVDFDIVKLTSATNPGLGTWLLIIAAVVFTTVHAQDMYDQLGDAQRGRMTMPIQMGETIARVSIAVFMVFWGAFCPYFWNCGWFGYAMTTPLANTVAYRSLVLRTVEDDQITWKLWNAWIVTLYALPLTRTANPMIMT